MLRERIHPGAWRVRVVVDCGNGTASLIAPQALEDLGCEVIRLYCESPPLSSPSPRYRPIFHRTGHSLIKAKMKEMGAVFTGEMSGHMFFADEYFGYDDAVYAAARLLRILSRGERPLSALLADVPPYHATPEIRVDCSDEVKFEVVRQITEQFRREYPVIDIDGVRVLFDGGWGLIRASNTQPALVVRAEAKSAQELLAIKRALARALAQFPGVGPPAW